MPPSPTRRQAHAAARREQLLLAAFEKFSSQGYRATSVRDLARALGVNEALLYHYFPSKAALFAEVLATYAPFQPGRTVPESERGQPLDRVLHAEGLAFLTLVQERRSFVMTVLTEGPGDPELGQILSRFLNATRQRIVGLLRERQAIGQIRPGASLASAANAFVGGLVFHFLATGLFAGAEAADPRPVVDGLVAVLLDGLRPT